MSRSLLFRWDKNRPEDDIHTMVRKELENINSVISKNTTKVTFGGTIGNDFKSNAIPTNNTYSIRLSHIVEFFNSSYITLSQQYGNIVDSIKIPIDFNIVNKITCYITVSDGNTIYQKYLDTLSESFTTTIGNSLEIALKYDSFILKARITEKDQYFQDVSNTYSSGTVVLNNGTSGLPNLQAVYTAAWTMPVQ